MTTPVHSSFTHCSHMGVSHVLFQVLFMKYRVLAEKGRHLVVMRRNGPLGVSVRVGFAPLGEVLEDGGRV